MARPEPDPPIADEVQWSEAVTEYDKQHFEVYLRLLDAEEEGASEAEMARHLLGIEPNDEPDRAIRAVKSHLERARWMAETGALKLLQE